MRRYGERVDPAMRYTLRPGAYVILQKGRELLLTMQDGVRLEHPELQLPGGGIDAGEHVIPALHREVMEETGWRMDKPRRLGAFKRYVFMPDYDIWAEKICAIYWSRPTLQMCDPLEQQHTAVWMPIEVAAAQLPDDGGAAFIRNVMR